MNRAAVAPIGAALSRAAAKRCFRNSKPHNLPIIDRLAQFYSGDDQDKRRETYLDYLRTLEPGFHELIIHCGYDNEELRAITSSAARRDADRRVFTDPGVAALVRELNIEVITWKQLRALQDKQATEQSRR